ncbi:unnamed protein product [Rhodiola kirilowii]
MEEQIPVELQDQENQEISINYASTGIIWNRNENIDDIFSYNVATDIMNENNGDPEPLSITDCKSQPDWIEWKKAVETELDSLNKRKKRNEKNEIVRYKARLVAQGFSQRPGIDFEETYSPVMDGITFRYLISLAVHEKLNMHLMDVVTAYLYGSLDTQIYMRILEGFKMPEASSSKPRERYSVKLERSLYGLKQSGRMWYNRLKEYLSQKGYVNDPLCPCVFIKKTTSGCVIIAVYVDDLNIIGTNEEIHEVISYLKREFEMKDLGRTKYCLGLQIEHLQSGILVHQSNYSRKIIKRFNMDKCNPLSTLMVRDSVPLLRKDTGAESSMCFDTFKERLGLFYPNDAKPVLIGYADACYLSDPHKGKSQTGYVITCGGTAISWRSQKQTVVATSSNHAEVISLHEASRECVWFKSITQHIRVTSGLSSVNDPITLYEDNVACVSQMKKGFIKSDRTKAYPSQILFVHPRAGKRQRCWRHVDCFNLVVQLTEEYNQPEVSFPRPRLRSSRLATGSKIGSMAKPLLGCGARRQFDAPLGCISASSAGRSHSEMRLGDEEPFWLSLTKEFVGAIKSLFSFLYDQPRQLRYIEWPTFSSTFKTATLTLVLVALLIIALATVDSGLCYFLALFLRRKP